MSALPPHVELWPWRWSGMNAAEWRGAALSFDICVCTESDGGAEKGGRGVRGNEGVEIDWWMR